MSKARDTLRSEIGTFVMLPTWVLDRVLDANAVHAYAVIARHANHHERRAWPGQDRIARQMGASISTVQRAVRVLRERQVIETQPRREGGVVVGTDYILLAKPYASPVTASSASTEGTPLDIVVGQVTDAHTTRQSCTSKHGVPYKEELDPLELDPKSAYARVVLDDDVLVTYAATIFAEYRLGWERLYKQPVSLLSSPLDLHKIQTHLKVLGLTRLSEALAKYFATMDDRTVRARRHPLGLFLVNPAQYLVDELVHVPEARTGNERRRATHESNATHVASQGRLAGKLRHDDDEGVE